MRNRTVRVHQNILALLGEEERVELHTLGGELYRTEERHYLHRLLGRLNKVLLSIATKAKIDQKQLQELISARAVAPLVALGFLEYATPEPVKHTATFVLRLAVDEQGGLLSGVIDDTEHTAVIQIPANYRNMTVEQLIFQSLGKFYKQGA